jgi:hypothetical protein
VEDVAAAVRKVCDNASELRGFEHPSIREKGMSRADRLKV